MVFAWSSENIDHIGKHDVSPDEAEYVVRNARPPFPEASGDGKYRVWGQTSNSRYLQVIFTIPDDEDVDISVLSPADRMAFAAGESSVTFVIHARDLEDSEKRQLRRRKR